MSAGSWEEECSFTVCCLLYIWCSLETRTQNLDCRHINHSANMHSYVNPCYIHSFFLSHPQLACFESLLGFQQHRQHRLVTLSSSQKINTLQARDRSKKWHNELGFLFHTERSRLTQIIALIHLRVVLLIFIQLSKHSFLMTLCWPRWKFYTRKQEPELLYWFSIHLH